MAGPTAWRSTTPGKRLLMPSPAFLVAFLLSIMATAWGSFRLGVDHEVASQAREDQHIAEAVDAATTVAAQAIASIKPKYTTIQNEVQREIQTNTVFTDCKLPADSLRLVNQALSPSSAAAGTSKLPGADPAR